MCRDHYGVLIVTAMGMQMAMAEVNCAAQFAVANISVVSAALLLQCPKTGNWNQRRNCPMLMPLKHIELPRSPHVPNMASQSAFPPLPKKTFRSRSYTRKTYFWCRSFSACRWCSTGSRRDYHYWTTWFFQPLVWQPSGLPGLFSGSHQTFHAGKR